MATALLPAMVLAGILGLLGIGLCRLLVSRNLIKLLLVLQILALVMQVHRRTGTLDAHALSRLRG